mmetsp:Transcript_58807/g.120306  ORF Transcript_58807/g.120306 Transcript_58807/m.120306 type:complete len:164 (-) Transcript_58807:2118-2609(-)
MEKEKETGKTVLQRVQLGVSDGSQVEQMPLKLPKTGLKITLKSKSGQQNPKITAKVGKAGRAYGPVVTVIILCVLFFLCYSEPHCFLQSRLWLSKGRHRRVASFKNPTSAFSLFFSTSAERLIVRDFRFLQRHAHQTDLRQSVTCGWKRRGRWKKAGGFDIVR